MSKKYYACVECDKYCLVVTRENGVTLQCSGANLVEMTIVKPAELDDTQTQADEHKNATNAALRALNGRIQALEAGVKALENRLWPLKQCKSRVQI